MDPYDVADEAMAALGNGPLLAPGSNGAAVPTIRSLPRDQIIMGMTQATADMYGLPPLKLDLADGRLKSDA